MTSVDKLGKERAENSPFFSLNVVSNLLHSPLPPTSKLQLPQSWPTARHLPLATCRPLNAGQSDAFKSDPMQSLANVST